MGHSNQQATQAIRRRLDARRAVLMERLEIVMEADASGEGAVTWLQLELIGDELQHLRKLYEVLLLDALGRKLDRAAC